MEVATAFAAKKSSPLDSSSISWQTCAMKKALCNLAKRPPMLFHAFPSNGNSCLKNYTVPKATFSFNSKKTKHVRPKTGSESSDGILDHVGQRTDAKEIQAHFLTGGEGSQKAPQAPEEHFQPSQALDVCKARDCSLVNQDKVQEIGSALQAPVAPEGQTPAHLKHKMDADKFSQTLAKS